MKIGNPTAGVQELAATSAAAPARPAPEDAARAAPGLGADPSAKVELSSTAASLMTGAKGVPAEFDADKVSRISQAIADGKFEVNAGAIADKLIANAQELLGSVKR